MELLAQLDPLYQLCDLFESYNQSPKLMSKTWVVKMPHLSPEILKIIFTAATDVTKTRILCVNHHYNEFMCNQLGEQFGLNESTNIPNIVPESFKFKSFTTKVTHVITDIPSNMFVEHVVHLTNREIKLVDLPHYQIDSDNDDDRAFHCFEINNGLGFETSKCVISTQLDHQSVYKSLPDIIDDSEKRWGVMISCNC